jgi:hypothetical protein
MKPSITVEYSDYFFRAVAKTGFHYALKFFPELRGDEQQFDGIRDFIMNGGDPSSWVVRRKSPFLEPLKSKLTPSRHCHILLADRRQRILKSQCLFYAGEKGDKLGYEVTLGENPVGLVVSPEVICHAFIYFHEAR